MAYPTYSIAGVACDDPSGRWELLPGTNLLPAFPGRRATNWTIPGSAGSRSSAYAPGESMTVSLAMRFNAVQGTAGSLAWGLEARTKAITENLDLFFQTTALARSGFLGLVEIRRHYSATDSRVCAGRLVASATPEYDPRSDYATLTLIFEVPSGLWASPSFTTTLATITTTGQAVKVKVPAGTAPAMDNVIALKGPFTSAYGSRVTITNGHGAGFKLGVKGKSLAAPSGGWLLINTNTWRYGVSMAATAAAIDWACPKPGSGLIEPRERPMGSALTILPEQESGVGWVHVNSHVANLQVAIRSRRMWY